MKGLSLSPVLSTGLLLLVHILTVNCSPASSPQARSEDAWLAVINGGTGAQAQPDALQARQAQDTEQYQFEQPVGLGVRQPIERVAQQPIDRVSQQPIDRISQQPIDTVPQPYDRVPQQQTGREAQQPVERVAQQPVVQQQFQAQLPEQIVPQQSVPQPQQPVVREPVRPGQLPRQPQRPPPRQPQRPRRPGQVPRPGQRPRPGFGNNRKKKPTGIVGSITGAIDGVVKGATCAATNLITDEKMKDESFIRFQLNCAMGRGPCDEIGNKIKILAPEVLAGRCPPPCDECTQKQIRRVMAELSQRFPTEFQQMMRKIRG